MQKSCAICGREVSGKGLYCGKECKAEAHKRAQVERYRRIRQKEDKMRRVEIEKQNASFMRGMEIENERRRAAGEQTLTYGKYVAWLQNASHASHA